MTAAKWRKSSYSSGASACVELSWRKSSFSNGPDACVEVGWRKSSFSGDGADCVEVGWRKSSSSDGADACVEVAPAPVGVAVRDTKRPEEGQLAFEQGDWQVFLSRL